MSKILSMEKGLNVLAICLDFPETMETKYKIMVLGLLTVVCGTGHDGHRKVMSSLQYYREKKAEKKRFEHLLWSLENCKELDLQVAYMSFINALINSPTDIDLRMAIRSEFLKLGLGDILEVY
jgi:hypothetical protein